MPGYFGYEAALINFRMIASAINNSENTVKAIKAATNSQASDEGVFQSPRSDH